MAPLFSRSEPDGLFYLGYFGGMAYATPLKNLESLMQALLRERDKIPVQELRAIVENFSARLRLCIRAKGGHFET